MARKNLEFTGKGFEREEFTPEERAEMRERGRYFDESHLGVDDLLEEAGLTWISNVAKGAPLFLKAFIFAGALAGAVFAMQRIGWL